MAIPTVSRDGSLNSQAITPTFSDTTAPHRIVSSELAELPMASPVRGLS